MNPIPPDATFIGIDVGASRKGFHAVALKRNNFKRWDPRGHLKDLVSWCLAQDPQVIAIDAPCGWSATGGSRHAERSLTLGGQILQCFKTPTQEHAKGSPFYDWVRNGQLLYAELQRHGFHLHTGLPSTIGRVVLETFPHAIACALHGRVIPATPKSKNRRAALELLVHRNALAPGSQLPATLPNIDTVDAALCAITARCHALHQTQSFGTTPGEGCIIIPDLAKLPQAKPRHNHSKP